MTFLLFKFKLSSQSCRALFISKLVSSPLALEITAVPPLMTLFKLRPLIETKARFIFIPEDLSAVLSAFLTEVNAESESVIYPCLIPKLGASPTPIILGFFSPFKNSPTTTLVAEDPTSMPTEIFLIIFYYCTTILYYFQAQSIYLIFDTCIGYNKYMNRAVLQKEFNRDKIDILKNDTSILSSFFETKNDSSIVYVLENLGRLENGHGKKPLLKLLDNTNENIRLLAIKNLAKIGDVSLLEIFLKFAQQDESTEVRRESVSAIGRLRNEKAIPILVKLLVDKDPKVVMQAIRGLLIFSKNSVVKQELKKLINHPNELIKEVIGKEINGVSYSSNN